MKNRNKRRFRRNWLSMRGLCQIWRRSRKKQEDQRSFWKRRARYFRRKRTIVSSVINFIKMGSSNRTIKERLLLWNQSKSKSRLGAKQNRKRCKKTLNSSMICQTSMIWDLSKISTTETEWMDLSDISL